MLRPRLISGPDHPCEGVDPWPTVGRIGGRVRERMGLPAAPRTE